VQEKLGELYQKLQDSLNADTPIVVVCGPAKCDDGLCDVCDQERKDECFYHERIVLKQCLRAENCLPVLFEEDFDLVIASLEETILLREDEVEKVIVIPASKGSAAELAQFTRDPKIRPKLVVLVPYRYHPWYSEKGSFLTYRLDLMKPLSLFLLLSCRDQTCKMNPPSTTDRKFLPTHRNISPPLQPTEKFLER